MNLERIDVEKYPFLLSPSLRITYLSAIVQANKPGEEVSNGLTPARLLAIHILLCFAAHVRDRITSLV